jgi:hypothetical protein
LGKELSTLPIRYRAAFTGGIALTLVLAGSLYLLFRDGDESERVPSSASVIDEIGGTYRGVGIGDSPADVRRVFGARDYADTSEGLMPVGAHFAKDGGPMVIELPERMGADRQALLRYEDVSFLFFDGKVFAVVVTADGAATARGVAIGHDIGSVKDRYETLTCGDAEPESGPYPYCAGELAPLRHIWFGQDPIGSITMATTPFDSYER